ncbi:leucine-rich repeat serine/threonine-protein kinase 1-like isoform X4 [Penaeus japonicus]|uniref:leucine-rich repeat serine/threonine-protein kinase 1-like isoform X4 n=1 Tax=Penaeus japonicus TaxID=27405 RepID=UPI001C711941|nr:leucine-rich repeat serine/threonine-protein kinase 1-like isoform X4 [Penaeus japonicus]
MADFVETDSPLPTPTLQRKSARMSAAGEGERPPAFVRQCCVRKKAGADDGSAEAKTHRRKARKKDRTMDACVATSYRTLPGSERGVGDVCGTRLKHSPKRRKSGDADSPRSPRTPVPAGVQSPRKVAKYGSSRAGEGEEARPVANGRHKAKHKGLPDGGRPNGDAGRGRMRRRSEEQHSGLSGAKKIIFRSSEALDVAAAARLDDVAEHRNLAGERYTTRSGESSEDTDSETAVLGVSYKPINVSGECWRFVGDRENGKTESAKFREERLNSKNLAKGDWGPARERRRWNSNHERGFPEEGRISTLWPSLRQEHKQRASGEIRDGLEDVGTEAVEVSPQSPKARTDSLFVQSQFPRRTSDIPVQSSIVRREWKRLSSPLAENGNATAPNALNPPGRRLPSRASRTRWSMFADMDIPKLLAQQKDTLGQMRYGEILNSIQMPRKASLGVEEGREVTEAKFSPDQTRSEKNYECRTGGILRESDEKENSPLRNAGKTNYGRRSLRDVEEVLEAARAFTSMSSALNNHMEVAHKESSTPQEIRKFALKSTLDRNDWKNKGGGFSFDKLVHVCSETVAQSIRQCIAESPDEVPANVKDIGLERGAVIIGDMIKEFVATLPSDADKSEEQPLKGEEDAEGDGAEATTLVEDTTTLHETKDDDDDGKDTPTSPPTPPPDEIREALLDDDEVETIKDSSSPRTSQDICDDNTSGKAPGGVRLSACGSAFVLPSFKKLEEPKVLSRRGSLDTQESSRIRLSKTGKIEVIDASEVGDEPDSITEEGRDHLESDDEGKFQDSVSSQQEGPDAPSSRRSSFTERFNLWRMSWKYKNDSQPPSRSESLKIRLMQRRASGSEFSVSYDSVRRSMSGNLNDLFSGGGQRRASTVETPRLARRNSEQKASYPRRGSLTNLIFRSASDTSASQRFNVDDRLRKINKMDKPSVERASDAYSYFFDYPVLHQDARELARQELHSALRESCSRGDVSRAKAILRDLGAEAEIIINSAPNGSNTLLFKACEEGQREMVRLLLDHGADGRIHPVTKYSPLYIACYYGRRDIAEMLLKKFPTLVNVSTVERWLPLHACIINGHTSVLELLLKFPYPEEALRKYWDKTGQYEYEMAFDINMKDVTGQSALYLACYVGNQKLVDLLLKHRIHATKVKTKEEMEKERQQKEMDSSSNDSKSSSRENTKTSIDSTSDLAEKSDDVASPTKHRISGGIQALMSKLNLVKTDANQKDNMISPLDIDMYCNSNTETALHIAVKNKHHSIVSMLLAAGANPNLRVYLPDDEMARLAEDEYIFTDCFRNKNFHSNFDYVYKEIRLYQALWGNKIPSGSTALVEACRNRDLGMLDLLLKSHARDDECKALFIAAHAKDEIIVSKLLALKAHPDPEFKVNKRALEIKPSQQFSSLSVSNAGGVYSSLAPSTPVMINWHGQRCLSYLKDQWLVDASVNLNPKLRLSPRNQVIALYAITRLDISNNALTELPDMIFQLPSLKTLNAAQNKIEKLPPNIGHFIDGTVTLPRKGSKKELVIGPLSVLEEVHLQDNRLDSLPDGIFTLPALQLLDVSNNKLSSLPYKIWTAPKLRELNASLNLLHDLPVRPEGQGHDSGVSSDAVSEVSDEDSLSSASELQLSLMDESTDESPARRKTPDPRGVLSLGKHGNVITCCRRRDLKHHSLWSNAVEIQESLVGVRETEEETLSNLQSLNLSHNSFSSVPSGLACLALSLNRLNLSYNRLSEMGAAICYPVGLKQLDLSHNRIRAWPTVSRSESLESLESTLPSCYALAEVSRSTKFACQGRKYSQNLNVNRVRGGTSSPMGVSPTPGLCIHRRHIRLESLRTLILADNSLTRLNLYLDDNEFSVVTEVDENEASPVRSSAPRKSWLLFPNLSMLDVSNNLLRELPTTLHELTNLSVLNISGNSDITELPPEMGLLSRLWNLNTRACSLQEPLKSMIDSKKYKTMDVIGYLKSILEDARPYARMKLMIVGVQGIGKTSLLEQLRQEGTGSYRKKPVEHWAKRMGNKNINTRTSRGTSMSTVGVDIGDWIFEKKIRGHSNYGPVVFRTWDFGGQKEYYATHQYFLSKRSLYLVVWKISDGERGVAEILQWLVNIQARAPNSPVLIVGTHYDLVKEKFPPSWSEDLQQMIRDRFINVIDADKLGLPRVLDTIEVSCKTRHNIKLLCNLIYDTVFSLKTPGSKERLLEQRIPASYLALEDVVGVLALERRVQGRDPVLPADKYQALVTQEMSARGHRPFRDSAELNQATTFLHENGVMLHYEDATLKDLYFLDPQWLCDMLAHVVTIREINPFARNGIMKLDDLKHVFKSSTCAPMDAKSYIVNLLNKFEVALTWDNRTLLIPSLLPSEEQLRSGLPGMDVRVKIPVRSRGWAVRSKKFSSSTGSTIVGNSAFYMTNADARKPARPLSYHGLTTEAIGSPKKESEEVGLTPSMDPPAVQVTHRSAPHAAIRRLLLMSYFPSGFWSRLITRILADDAVVDIIRNYFVMPREVLNDRDLSSVLGGQAEWVCWQTGMELHYAHTTLFRMREVLPMHMHCPPSHGPHTPTHGANHTSQLTYDYKSMRFLVRQEGVWSDVEVNNSAVLEIILPNEAVVIKRPFQENDATSTAADILACGIQSVVLDPAPECVAKLLSLAVDHIDTLLEDWYPTLGTRFVHTSEGKFLVTRLVPCPVCLECHGQHEGPGNHPQARHLPDNWGSFVEMNPLYCSMTASQISQDLNASSHTSLERSLLTNSLMGSLAPSQQGHPLGGVPSPQPGGRSSTSSTAAGGGGGGTMGGGVSPGGAAMAGNMSPQLPRRSWGSRESYTSDGDSGVGAESTTSSRKPSAEGRPDLDNSGNNEGETSGGQEVTPVVYSFMVEECILAAYTARSVPCPLHADLLLAQIAPDTVFLDLGDRYLVRPELIKQGKLLGRGGFGFVFQGACRNRASGAPMDVALKMLQPVDPGTSARQSAIVAYKAAQSKWERDPLQYACKAYCSARQEVNILLSLRHPHIVPLVGVCPRPLALVLELAPQGALDQCLKHYQRSGARLSLHTLQAVVLQVAKALEYLHGQHIIYRDLKSENVLVWELPPPFHHQPQPRVDVRLADYGISRSSLPTGTKGFGGTEGFMAPEMMRHNGEEEYTEKVDCFSFGMFMYELLTTHQPYEHCDNVKEHVLEGGRPALTHRETEYPVYVLDLMVMCWSQQPRLRPSASQIVSIASAPEFTHLLDVASLDHSLNIMDAIRVPPVLVKDEDGELVVRDQGSIWVSRTSPQLDMVGAGEWGWGAYTSIEGLPDTITAMCCVGEYVWLGDNAGNIHGYSTRDYGRVFSYCLEPDAPQSSPVRSLCSLHALGRVAVALCNGRLFLCSSDVTPTSPVLGEGSFVMTELAGSTQEIHCLAVAQTPTTWSLWCGGSEGTMSIFSLRDDGLVVSQDSVSHFTTSTPPPSGDSCDVMILHAPQTISTVSRHLRNSIWSYVYPGCVVYHWDVKEKKLVNRLDCSKLVPCSESLQSISIEEHLSPSQCQVSAVAVCGGEVYVGTTWGCVVVAEAESMRPITVFRPYEDEVRAIVPLPPTSIIVEPESIPGDMSDGSEGDIERLMNPVPLLATIGKGYRNLLGRYAPIPRSAQPEPGAQRAMYCLLWRAHHWLNT